MVESSCLLRCFNTASKLWCKVSKSYLDSRAKADKEYMIVGYVPRIRLKGVFFILKWKKKISCKRKNSG